MFVCYVSDISGCIEVLHHPKTIIFHFTEHELWIIQNMSKLFNLNFQIMLASVSEVSNEIEGREMKETFR